MIVTTMNDIPGYEVQEVFGEVMGLTVRSRNIGSQFGAGLKSIFGGELKGMTKALVDSRHEVMDRMTTEAEAKGANAIIAMRFDTSEFGNTGTEICAGAPFVTLTKERASSGRKTLRRGSNSGLARADVVSAPLANSGFCPPLTQAIWFVRKFQWVTLPGSLM